jgi:hypothetical protein
VLLCFGGTAVAVLFILPFFTSIDGAGIPIWQAQIYKEVGENQK